MKFMESNMCLFIYRIMCSHMLIIRLGEILDLEIIVILLYGKIKLILCERLITLVYIIRTLLVTHLYFTTLQIVL